MNRYGTVVLVALLLCVGIAVAAIGDNAAKQVADAASSGRVCFPAKDWGPAPEGERPCAEVAKVWEDGSIRVRVTSADGTYRYTSSTGARDR